MSSIHRTRPLVAFALVLAAVGASANPAEVEPVTLTEQPTSFNSGGLVTTGTDDLIDASGAKVGTTTFTCITAAPGVLQCSLVYELPGGKLTAAGTTHPVTGASPIFDEHVAITGGTGRYVGAIGDVRIVQEMTGAKLTFNVIVEPRRRPK